MNNERGATAMDTIISVVFRAGYRLGHTAGTFRMRGCDTSEDEIFAAMNEWREATGVNELLERQYSEVDR
jgi:hypothetical protein